MAYKFIRAIEYLPLNSSGQALAAFFKLLYEGWCYCQNGGSDPTVPGGLAATTPSTLPLNLREGTSVLATGTDGATNIGSSQFFTSATANFPSTVIGKHLVAWKPGSGSTEDSIYMIRARPDANTLVIEARNGGTPDIFSRKPALTNRTGICYRIVDVPSVLALMSDGQYLVFQLNGASVNSGQANAQVQLIRRGSGLTCGIVVSPAGTWNGSAFTDGTAESTGFGYGGGSSNTAYMSMILDPAMILTHTAGSFGGGAMHVEIPQRLYTQAQDPNPIAWQLSGGGGSVLFDTNNGYGNAMRMIGTDNVVRTCRMIVRSLAGDGQDSTHRTVPGVTMTNPGSSVNPVTGGAMSSEALLGTMATGQYAFARVKLRGMRVAGAYYPNFFRFGDIGEWLHITNGVYWPWDNAVLPFNLFAGGI